MAEQQRKVGPSTRLHLSVGVNFEAAALEAMQPCGGWPFADAVPDIMDGVGCVRPDAFDEPSPESKAIWERNCKSVIDQIAEWRARG